MADPLVSVVVPVYKVEPYLARCLDSLLAQDYSPIEIVAVEDGSPDRCGTILDRYAERWPSIRALHLPHRGLGPARNAGVHAARGDFVVYVDSDDYVEPDYVSTLVRLAQESDADVAVAGFTMHLLGLRLPFPLRRIRRPLTGPEAARASLNQVTFPSFAWAKLYRRSLLVEGGVPFPAIYYEDVATTPRVLMNAARVAGTTRRLYHYCLRGDSIVGNFGVKNIASYLAALGMLRRFLAEQGLSDAWSGGYRALLRTARLLLTSQILVQPNTIPLRARPAVLRWLHRGLVRLGGSPAPVISRRSSRPG